MVPVEGLLGYVLLLVGTVFFGNGLTLLGKTGAKEVGVLNVVVGVFITIAAYQLHTLGLTAAFALVSVFALIYFQVAGVFMFGYDGKGVGWFCLFVTPIFIWYAYFFFAMGDPGMWFAVFCLSWALLVFMAFFALALGKAVAPIVAWLFIIESVITLLIPGMLLLTDKWNPFGGVPPC